MEWKKKKKREYFILSLFESFNGRNRKFIILIWKFMWEEIECVVGFTHSSQIPQTLQFLYPQIWEELEEIKLDLYNFFIKTPKYSCIHWQHVPIQDQPTAEAASVPKETTKPEFQPGTKPTN